MQIAKELTPGSDAVIVHAHGTRGLPKAIEAATGEKPQNSAHFNFLLGYTLGRGAIRPDAHKGWRASTRPRERSAPTRTAARVPRRRSGKSPPQRDDPDSEPDLAEPGRAPGGRGVLGGRSA